MILKSYFIIFSALTFSVSVVNASGGHTNIENWMKDAVTACINAQLENSSPLWDRETKWPANNNSHVVGISQLPSIAFYTITISLEKPYPDGPLSLCRMERETHRVLYVAHYSGDPGYGEKQEIELIDHDPLDGVTESELEILILQASTMSFPLEVIYRSTGRGSDLPN